MNFNPKLILGPVTETIGLEGLNGQRIFCFPFVNEENITVFTLNAISDTKESAVEELRALLNNVLVEVSMQFPRVSPSPYVNINEGKSAGIQCKRCSFTAGDLPSMKEHYDAMHEHESNN